MRIILLLLSVVLVTGCSGGPEDPDTSLPSANEYDAALATRLGADEYGMRRYVMALLKAGPNRNLDAEAAERLQRAHLDNIGRLADAGKLSVAGPFLDDGKLRGIYIFNVETIEEARQLTATDPAVKAGSLVMELHPWYGSAALMQVYEVHKKLAQKKI
ncbi:MAG: YciI family protein [bacterium]